MVHRVRVICAWSESLCSLRCLHLGVLRLPWNRICLSRAPKRVMFVVMSSQLFKISPSPPLLPLNNRWMRQHPRFINAPRDMTLKDARENFLTAEERSM